MVLMHETESNLNFQIVFIKNQLYYNSFQKVAKITKRLDWIAVLFMTRLERPDIIPKVTNNLVV